MRIHALARRQLNEARPTIPPPPPLPRPAPRPGEDPLGGAVRLIDRFAEFLRRLGELDDLFSLPPMGAGSPPCPTEQAEPEPPLPPGFEECYRLGLCV